MTDRAATRRRSSHVGVIVSIALLMAACADTKPPTARPTTGASPAPSPTVVPGTPAPTPGVTEPSVTPIVTIPQPVPPDGLAVAPDSARVDLVMPVFSNPTQISNRLFPISRQASVLMVGHVDDKPFRTEVTLLPFTRLIDWQGQRVETLVSQYVAYLDGRITEVAYDYYAQDDAGAVWYFGEDVFDFVDGAIVTTEGTWLAGKDGPAAMIMPARPKVGDVYRPENVPGFVFEEVTIKAVDQPLDGPLGPISGGLVAHELHADGATEDKVFAPGYGEFLTGGGGDVEALALAVPTDALTEAMPADLRALSGGAMRIFESAGSGDWVAAKAEKSTIRAAWSAHRQDDVPKPIEPLMTQAIGRLSDAVDARSTASARGVSIEVARLAFDLQLRYRPAAEVDLARFDLWAAQLIVDAAAHDATGVNADVFALDYIRDRFIHTLDPSAASAVNSNLGELQGAVIDDELDVAIVAAQELRTSLAQLLRGN